jgi:hypothetical protein
MDARAPRPPKSRVREGPTAPPDAGSTLRGPIAREPCSPACCGFTAERGTWISTRPWRPSNSPAAAPLERPHNIRAADSPGPKPTNRLPPASIRRPGWYRLTLLSGDSCGRLTRSPRSRPTAGSSQGVRAGSSPGCAAGSPLRVRALATAENACPYPEPPNGYLAPWSYG